MNTARQITETTIVEGTIHTIPQSRLDRLGYWSHTEREANYIRIYEADYGDGKGPQRRAEGVSRIEIFDGQLNRFIGGANFGRWDDGHPERVAQWEKKLRDGLAAEEAEENETTEADIKAEQQKELSFRGSI